jgi:2,4-dienoyl-CoA reductase-like NADH-dependent reductase (Old Yellow Enzyme family)
MSQLFSPLALRGLTLKNRLAVSPMCQYSAKGGMASDYHLVHDGRFALGGFGLVIVEATAVSPEGRITYGDLGLWNDAQIAPLRRISEALKANGAAAGIQIAHAGRKASTPLWWRGSFNETEAEKPLVGFESWTPLAPSALPHSAATRLPRAMTAADIAATREAFIAAARRADAAGFDLLEVHCAHGYLLNQFLSAVANQRDDDYGGTAEKRRRLPLEVVAGVRAAWPAEKPLLVRISVEDHLPGGVSLDDSIAFARALKALGVDVIDCSSGGFDGAAVRPGPCYQVPYAAAIRMAADIETMAVGLITTAEEAEGIVARGDAALVALGRTALDDPNWPAHAARALGADNAYGVFNKQAGFAVKIRDGVLKA